MAISQNDPIKATEVVDALNKKVNTSDVLTLSSIRDSTDLTGKVPSAEAIRDTLTISNYHNEGERITIKIPPNFVIILAGDGNDSCYLRMIAGYVLETIVSVGYTSAGISIDAERRDDTIFFWLVLLYDYQVKGRAVPRVVFKK